MMYHPSIPFRF